MTGKDGVVFHPARTGMNGMRRSLNLLWGCWVVLWTVAFAVEAQAAKPQADQPNVVIIF